MERSFFKFVWRYSRREQLTILALTILSFPLVYISLEIPKRIINEAIDGTDFPRVILGFEFEQVPYLLLLCGFFLFMVMLINIIKWFLNLTIGMTGERMLRRLRFMLFEHVMRFPMRRFRTTKPGELIQSILGEIEPLGGFIGEVIATPAFQGGLLVVYCLFIFIQDFWLGLAAISLYPFQAWLIPRLQARVIKLNKERALNTRVLADTIAESVARIADIQTNDTARWHMAQVSGRLFQNTMIRMALFRRKFTIKFINNFLNQLTPFFFYAVGGYFVIRGRLDFGSLVAVLAAYKDLAAPWKAVLNYVQRWADFNGRYGFVTEAFLGDDVYPAGRVYGSGGAEAPLSGDLVFNGVESGSRSSELSVENLDVAPGNSVAVIGGESGANEFMMRMAAGLEEPASGRVAIGGQALIDASLGQIGATLAYLDGDPGLVNRSIRDNLLYGLFRNVPELGNDTSSDWGDARKMKTEAGLTGNISADPDGDWVDYDAAGLEDGEALNRRLSTLTEEAGLADDLFAGALASRIPRDDAPRWTIHIRDVRQQLSEMLEGEDLSDVIEAWDIEQFNGNASLIENILFAMPVEPGSDSCPVEEDPRVRKILESIGAETDLAEVGWKIAGEFADLVSTVGTDSAVLDGFAAYPRVDILAAGELVSAHQAVMVADGIGAISRSDRGILVGLAARFVPTRDRIDVLNDDLVKRLLAQRHEALAQISGNPDFIRFDQDQFNPSQTIAENVLDGKRRFDRRSAWKGLELRIEQAIAAAGLRDDLVALGLAAPAGPGGGNLPMLARRRVALVRAILKRPRLIILNGVWIGLGGQDQAMRELIRRELPDVMLLFGTAGKDAPSDASAVYVIGEGGRLEPCQPPTHEKTE